MLELKTLYKLAVSIPFHACANHAQRLHVYAMVHKETKRILNFHSSQHYTCSLRNTLIFSFYLCVCLLVINYKILYLGVDFLWLLAAIFTEHISWSSSFKEMWSESFLTNFHSLDSLVFFLLLIIWSSNRKCNVLFLLYTAILMPDGC